jgi:hypothetical protein
MAGVSRNPRPLFVTSLPAGYDGQEVFYQSTTAGTGGGATDTMATVGAVWHLRYRSGSASAYKWEVVGAAPFIASVINVGAGENTAATHTAYQSLTTPLTFVAAEKGDYRVTIGCEAKPPSTAGEGAVMSYKIGTTTASDNDRLVAYTPASNTHVATMMRDQIKDLSGATIAERTLTAQFKSSTSQAATFYNRSLGLTPIRVG